MIGLLIGLLTGIITRTTTGLTIIEPLIVMGMAFISYYTAGIIGLRSEQSIIFDPKP